MTQEISRLEKDESYTLILKDKILFETLEKIKMSVLEIDKSPSSEQKNEKKLVTKLVGNRGTQTPDREFPT